jgi:pantoate kinase
MNKIKTATAFAPAAISSFFEIHDTEGNKPITNLEKIGARGGGFGLQKGVLTKVTVQEAEKTSRIKIYINSKLAMEAKTTRKVVEMLLGKTERKCDVTVEHQIEVPIGTGFGTSAGGALTAGLALKEALALPLTYNQIGKIAHVAEIEYQTGLGTVSALTLTGGCVLVVEPGAPGICQIDRIPITPDYTVVAGFFQSKALNKTVLADPEKKKMINRYGKKTLAAILAEPSLENFLEQCWEFSQKAGFATQNVRQLVKLAKQAGAVGAAQNMIGEAVHALVHDEKVEQVTEAFKQVLPSEKVIVSKIDFQGARLVEHAGI